MVPASDPPGWPPAYLNGRLHRAHARMLCALLASVLLHLWFAGGTLSGAIRMTVPLPVQRLEARLEYLSPSLELSEPEHGRASPGLADPAPGEQDMRRARAPTARSTDPRAAAAVAQAGPEIAVQEMPRADSTTTDPVYYSARELDVYPVPLVPMQFEYPARFAQAGVSGEVRVRLLVDEAGMVDRAVVIAAQPPGHFEEYARAKLASVRFSPGRREGQAVKSQLTVQVSFDSATRAGTLQ